MNTPLQIPWIIGVLLVGRDPKVNYVYGAKNFIMMPSIFSKIFGGESVVDHSSRTKFIYNIASKYVLLYDIKMHVHEALVIAFLCGELYHIVLVD